MICFLIINSMKDLRFISFDMWLRDPHCFDTFNSVQPEPGACSQAATQLTRQKYLFASLAILVPLWFIIISLVLFRLSKPLFSGFPQFKMTQKAVSFNISSVIFQ